MRGLLGAPIVLALLVAAAPTRAQDSAGIPSGEGSPSGREAAAGSVGDAGAASAAGATAARASSRWESATASSSGEPTPGAAAIAPGGRSEAGQAGTGSAPGGPRLAAMPEPLPIMVAVIATGRLSPEIIEAVRSAVIALIEPMAGGRPVRPLLAADLQAAMAACRDAPCIGQRIADAGAVGAVIARVSRRTPREPIEVRLEMVDPVSGHPRLAPILTTISDPASVAPSLAPFAETLRAAMFPPPPPPPQLLVTVDIDGATVRVDDEVVGESPVAPVRLPPGRHVVTVEREGYVTVRREVELDMGEHERIDVTLQSYRVAGIEPPAAEGSGGSGEGGPQWYEHWAFWTAVGGTIALGIAVGIAVGVATSSQGPPPNPQGIRLPPIR